MSRTVLITDASVYAGPFAVRALLDDNYQVICHDSRFLDKDARKAFTEEFPQALLLEAVEPEAAVAEALHHSDGIDVLFDNHLDYTAMQNVEEGDIETFQRLLDSLLITPYRFVQAVVSQMKLQQSGRIIVVTSAAPQMHFPGALTYTIARGAANLMVQSLAKELGPFGISANAIGPAFFASKDTYSQERFDADKEYREDIQRQVPLKRLSKEGELEALIAYLASEQAAFINGQIIPFAGGAVFAT